MSDYMVRATAAGAQIRAFACTTKDVVETARRAHDTSPVVTAALGRLLSAGAMMGSMQKGEEDLVTLQIKGDGPMQGLLVTADSKGGVKGYANVPDVILPANALGKLDVAGAVGQGTLSVIRDMGLKEPYVGQTLLQTSEIAEDLTYYFATSEQTPSSVALGVLMNKENTVRRAGGFIIQLLPGASEEIISGLEKTLGGMAPVTSLLDQGMTPEQILDHVIGDYGLEIQDRLPVQFACSCSRERIEKARNSFLFEIDVLKQDFDFEDPEQKTGFYNRVAQKLLSFSDALERDTYTQAVSREYYINYQDLKQLVNRMGLRVSPETERAEGGEGRTPFVARERKREKEDGVKRSQRLLLTWLIEDPALFDKIEGIISPEDFKEELYHQVAQMVFDGHRAGDLNPAGILNRFINDEAQYKEVAGLFNASLRESLNQEEQKKAFAETVKKVKKNSLDEASRAASDIEQLQKIIQAQKELKDLNI